MLSLGSSHRYYLYCGVTDMRKGFDGLSALVRSSMGGNPLSGDVFIFVNRRRDRMKLLVWDRSGFVLWYKRLEQGTFEMPGNKSGDGSIGLSWEKLVMILEGVELRSVRMRRRFSLRKTA